MRTLIHTLILLLSLSIAHAQSGVISLLTLESDGSDDFYIAYKAKEGDSAASLSQKFGHSIADLSEFNGFDIETIKKYTKIKVPFSNETITGVTEETNTAFVYVVKPQETLYTIGKKYFEIETDQIKKWNNLSDNNISAGATLIVGYATLNNGAKKKGKTTPYQPKATQSTSTRSVENSASGKSVTDVHDGGLSSHNDDELGIDELLDLLDSDDSEATVEIMEEDEPIEIEEVAYAEEKGLAYTENVNQKSTELFVLHPSAPVNSEIEITYPMLNTSVKAKVISALPKELYPSNISVVISPSVAKALGAKDDQFRVEMKYIAK